MCDRLLPCLFTVGCLATVTIILFGSMHKLLISLRVLLPQGSLLAQAEKVAIAQDQVI